MIIAAAASAVTDALSRFDQAGHALLGAMSMGGEGAPEAMGAMIEAKVQFRASATLVRLSDDMMRELIDVVANEPR